MPLDRTQGVEDVSYQQFERGDADDLIYLIALAHTKDAECLREGEDSTCAEIFEEFANGGMEIVRDWLLTNGGEYTIMRKLKLQRKYENKLALGISPLKTASLKGCSL